jgi:hypothetical protein
MTHICVANFQRLSPPFVDLAGRRSPHDILKQHISENMDK